MSGFFTLDGNCNKDHQDQDHHHQPTDNNNSSLFLFKNEEIYNKDFELWQQYYQLHQQRQNHHQDVDFSVGPPSRRNNNSSDNNIIFNGNNNNGGGGGDDQSSSYNSDRSAAGFRVMRQGRSGGNESINCQDCGNQAKKDCAHLRCRTCCKSRGFHCQTHVKSTWVPAAKRRERQQQLSTMLQTDQLDDAGRGENLKRMRENPGCSGGGGRGSALACTNSRLPATTTGFELGHFPAEVNSPAVFRCVRVSSADDAGEHLAYQTAVNIGGHVFKGILYHQGPESRAQSGGDIPSGFGGSQQPQHQPFHLTASTAGHNLNTTTTMLDPSIYPTAPLNAFMAGTQFFPPPTTHFRSTSS